jgi:antitoxin YqcF
VEVTEFERSVGRHVQRAFGGSATARAYGDDFGEYKVAVVRGPDCPSAGITSYSTVGLANFLQDAGRTQVRVEVVGAAPSIVDDYALTISSCFFEHVRNSSPLVYGAVIRDIVAQYGLSASLPHFTFVAPFLWPSLSRAQIADQEVYWLYAIPISEPEAGYISSHGIDALEGVFEAEQVDLFNLERLSVV